MLEKTGQQGRSEWGQGPYPLGRTVCDELGATRLCARRVVDDRVSVEDFHEP